MNTLPWLNPQRTQQLLDALAQRILIIDGAMGTMLQSYKLDEAGYAEVRIDLTRVREFHDFGVALLAQAISTRRAPTAVLGLREHHLRLLRYLGIDCEGANLAAGVELA